MSDLLGKQLPLLREREDVESEDIVGYFEDNYIDLNPNLFTTVTF